ncbi:MAG: DUF2993 domain-containing protein [Desertifilum sp. SIO1I2]|nr:DUF2993 domain-containing protein [Desertifilum sp. SIO1I2]
MFTGITGIFNSPNGTDMGEQLLNKVASQSIRHLFTRSEAIDIAIRCYPSSKLLQGSIDGFQMNGRGLVIRKDFYVEEMSFQTDAVALDVGAIFSGQLRLKQPTQAVAQVTLSEAGINEAFKSPLVTQRLLNLSLPAISDRPLSFQDIHVELLPHNQIQLLAKADLGDSEPIPIALNCTLEVERRRRIAFTHCQFRGDLIPEATHSQSELLTQALSEILNNMVDLDRFDLDGVTLRINRLETQGKQLLFSGYAQIEHFPGSTR